MINWARISELRAEIGDEDLQEVIGMFLEEADEVIARLAGPTEPATLESDLHFLKGSALNLGFQALAALCQDGERRAAQGDAASVDVPPIVAVYEESKRAFLGDARLSSAA